MCIRDRPKHRGNAKQRQLIIMSAAQLSDHTRVQSRLFGEIGIGNLQAPLRFANDVGKIVLEWNVHDLVVTLTSCHIWLITFSIVTAAAATDILIAVSFSIEVIITLEIPQGVIWLNGERSPHTFNANPCIVIQWRTPTPIDATLRC